MASDLITNVLDMNMDDITYGNVRANARGGKSIKVLDPRKNTLVLSTPLMLSWGINKMVDDDTGRVNYTLSLQFPSEGYGNDETNTFFDKMKEFENRILDDAVKHSKDWFNKKSMSREVAEALFTPILKYPKDKTTGEPDYDRAPSLRVKIPFWDGKFNVELYDINSTPLFTPDKELTSPFENLVPKKSHVATAIQCGGLWFAGGKFGVTWSLVQAIVRRPLNINGNGQCLLSLSASDIRETEVIAQREAEQAAAQDEEDDIADDVANITTTEVADSDDEEEEAPAPAPAPAPKKKVVKKKVVKKKVSS